MGDVNQINKDNEVIIQVRHDKQVMLDIIQQCDEACCATYIVILSHKNQKYNSCYPSLKTIANETSCSLSTVQRRIAKLHNYGFLQISSGTVKRNSHYYFPKEPGMYNETEMQLINDLVIKTDRRMLLKKK